MSKRTAGASNASPASTYVDPGSHPGFVNLGNTCFLNSVLQATSATQSLKQLYQPDNLPDKSAIDLMQARQTDEASFPGSLATLSDDLILRLSERSKSPVLQLADEEHGRIVSRPASRRSSNAIDSSLVTAMLSQASVKDEAETPTLKSSDTSIHKKAYELTPADLPLNTAFRQILEKTWKGEEKKVASSSKSSSQKAPALNPKKLLSIMASKYDQYGEYGQQDGHELLRHLLDSLRMEELDVSLVQ
jgi:hypothetical protein